MVVVVVVCFNVLRVCDLVRVFLHAKVLQCLPVCTLDCAGPSLHASVLPAASCVAAEKQKKSVGER